MYSEAKQMAEKSWEKSSFFFFLPLHYFLSFQFAREAPNTLPKHLPFQKQLWSCQSVLFIKIRTYYFSNRTAVPEVTSKSDLCTPAIPRGSHWSNGSEDYRSELAQTRRGLPKINFCSPPCFTNIQKYKLTMKISVIKQERKHVCETAGNPMVTLKDPHKWMFSLSFLGRFMKSAPEVCTGFSCETHKPCPKCCNLVLRKKDLPGGPDWTYSFNTITASNHLRKPFQQGCALRRQKTLDL